MVIASEPDLGTRFSESLIKQLTGGDVISARRLYREPVEFRPAFKLCIYGNHRPAIRGGDHGIWRRVLLMPFEQAVPAINETLKSKNSKGVTFAGYTNLDGDTVFSLATGSFDGDASVSRIGALAADVMAEAIVRAVRAATSLPGIPAARDMDSGR